MSCINGIRTNLKQRNSYKWIHTSLIMIGSPVPKETVKYLLLALLMEVSESTIKLENYKKLFKMLIPNLLSVLNGAMMEGLLQQQVKTDP